MNRRSLLATAAALALLGGCAAIDTLTAEVSSFGEWPAGRRPGTYAFERLPSQQAAAGEAEALERAAAPALARAGLAPVGAGQEPDVLVQIGARFMRTLRSPWDDPLWWHGGFGTFHHRPWGGPSWGLGLRFEPPRYAHEVALLLRDRASGKPLVEARAATDSGSRADAATVQALFAAALADFPRPALSPRQVTVPMAPAAR